MTAFCGTSRAFSATVAARRTRPNWPGRSRAFGLGNSATILRVPVFRSTARSAMMMRPFCGKRRAVGQDQFQFAAPALHLAFGSHALIDQVLTLADAHEDAHRIDIGDGGEQGGLALPDEVAGGHLARAGDAVDGRRDGAVLHVEFGLRGCWHSRLPPPPAPAGSRPSGSPWRCSAMPACPRRRPWPPAGRPARRHSPVAARPAVRPGA